MRDELQPFQLHSASLFSAIRPGDRRENTHFFSCPKQLTRLSFSFIRRGRPREGTKFLTFVINVGNQIRISIDLLKTMFLAGFKHPVRALRKYKQERRGEQRKRSLRSVSAGLPFFLLLLLSRKSKRGWKSPLARYHCASDSANLIPLLGHYQHGFFHRALSTF